MTETDELRHALQLVQNAIEGDTSGLKEAWNLISSHIDILEQPSPVSLDTHTAEEILKSKFIIGGKTYYEWPNIRNRNDIYPKIIEAMTEYASLRENKAIQETLQKVKDLASKYYDGEMLKTVNKFLDTIKSDQPKQ